MGVASLLIALGLPILFFAVFVIMVLLQGQIQDAVLMNLTVILIGSFVGALGHLIGFILGIAGAFQKENKKVLPVLGIVLNCIPILFAGFVCILLVAFLIHPFPLGPK